MTKNTKISHGLAIKADELILELGFSSKKVLFISDEKIWQNCQQFFDKNFIKKIGKILLLKNPQADEKNLQKISAALKNYDLIIGLGSGTINDLCKFTSAQKKVPYAIFASAASMNGYISKNASITISGHKKTLSATLPLAVFCDLGILQSAPLDLTKAGLGDALCFYSCWFDWYLSHKILGTKFNKKPFELLKKEMDFLIKNFKKFALCDEDFLKLLIKILLLSGQGMTEAGGSYPASQSEHLISHTIEMKYPKIAKNNLHGQTIAVTTLTAAKLQKKLLQKTSSLLFPHPSSLARRAEDPVSYELQSQTHGILGQRPRMTDVGRIGMIDVEGDIADVDCWNDVEKFFGKKIAVECAKEYIQKIFSELQTNKFNKNLQKNWPKIKGDLAKIHLDETRLKEIFSHFKIKTSAKSLGLSSQQYQGCVAHAKFMRNRFTCLDLV